MLKHGDEQPGAGPWVGCMRVCCAEKRASEGPVCMCLMLSFPVSSSSKEDAKCGAQEQLAYPCYLSPTGTFSCSQLTITAVKQGGSYLSSFFIVNILPVKQ